MSKISNKRIQPNLFKPNHQRMLATFRRSELTWSKIATPSITSSLKQSRSPGIINCISQPIAHPVRHILTSETLSRAQDIPWSTPNRGYRQSWPRSSIQQERATAAWSTTLFTSIAAKAVAAKDPRARMNRSPPKEKATLSKATPGWRSRKMNTVSSLVTRRWDRSKDRCLK